jgi:hypothetical protein
MPEHPTPAGRRAKLRWYQFGLRTLLIFVTLVVAFCCWFGYKLRTAREQRAAVVEIESHNTGESYVLYAHPSQFFVHMEKLLGRDFCYDVSSVGLDKPNEKLFAALDRIPNFSHLVISNGKATPTGFEHIVHNKSLKYLRLMNADFPFEKLTQLKSLEGLYLEGNNLTDSQVSFINGLVNLKILRITSSSITDQGMASVRQLPGLKCFSITSKTVTSRGLRFLEACTHLERIGFNDTPDINEVLKNLDNKNQLREVDLEKTGVTDKCLERLAKISGLERLYLGETAITSEGLKQFSGAKGLYLNIHDTPAAAYLKDNPSELKTLQSLMPGVTIYSKP